MLSSIRRQMHSGTSNGEGQDPFKEDVNSRKKSRRPKNTAFYQQRLKSWQPILTPRTVLPLLLILTVICVPIGIAFLITTYNVQKIEINYTKCNTLGKETYTEIPDKYYGAHFRSSSSNDQTSAYWKYNSGVCTVKFDVLNDINGPIYLYYKLTNFHQNHRKYVGSYDWNQLRGQAVSKSALSTDCGVLRYRDNKIIYPCGLVANSMFNDTYSDLKGSGNNGYKFSSQGIAWASDLKLYKRTSYNLSQIVPPENWIKKYPNGYTDKDLDDLATNEKFMNWMKTAALPSFLKMDGINKKDTLNKGTYEMDIEMNYPVEIFGGSKVMVISTSSTIGGRNMGLGICYLIVGAIAIFFMVAFLVKQIFTKKRLNNHTFLEELTGDREADSEQSPRNIL